MDRFYNLRRASEKALQEKYDEALRFLNPVVQADANDLEAKTLLSDIYWRMGRREEALKIGSELEAVAPGHPEVLALQADLLRYQEKWVEAERKYRAAIKAFPEHRTEWLSDMYLNLGTVLWEQRHREEALDSWKTAIELNPKNEKAQENLLYFTNEYGEPKSPASDLDDFYAFIRIQQEAWQQWMQKRQRKVALESINNDFMPAVQNLWNHLPFKEDFECMTGQQKRSFFQSLRIDWDGATPYMPTWETLTAMAEFPEKYLLETIHCDQTTALNLIFSKKATFPGLAISALLHGEEEAFWEVVRRLKKETKIDPYWPVVFLGASQRKEAVPLLLATLSSSRKALTLDAALWALSLHKENEIVSGTKEIIATRPPLNRCFAYGVLENCRSSETAKYLLSRLGNEKKAEGALFLALGGMPAEIVLKPLETFHESYDGPYLADLEEALIVLYTDAKTKREPPIEKEHWAVRFYPNGDFGHCPIPSAYYVSSIFITKKSPEIRTFEKSSLESLRQEAVEESKRSPLLFCDCCQKPFTHTWGIMHCVGTKREITQLLPKLVQNMMSLEDLDLYDAAVTIAENICQLKPTKGLTEEEVEDEKEMLRMLSQFCIGALAKGIETFSDLVTELRKESFAKP